MTDKFLYKITYAKLYGETMSYGYVIYTHAYSDIQAITQMKYRLGREYKQARSIKVIKINKKEASS